VTVTERASGLPETRQYAGGPSVPMIHRLVDEFRDVKAVERDAGFGEILSP
jgi:hypothetical protein